jgi:hypothetical protein
VSHRLSADAEVDGRNMSFALLYPGIPEHRKRALLRGEKPTQDDVSAAVDYARKNPDYMRELDRGTSMRSRRTILTSPRRSDDQEDD